MARGDEEEFIKRLMAYAPHDDDDNYRASKGRAARAALRRGLGKDAGIALEMIPYVASALPSHRLEEEEEQDYYLIASLFALHPPKEGESGEQGGDFGASMRRLALASEQSKDVNASPDPLTGQTTDESLSASVEKRFGVLLATSHDALHIHLRHAVVLLAAHEIPVYWVGLLRDVRRWDNAKREVQRRWGRSFWLAWSRNAVLNGTAAVRDNEMAEATIVDNVDDIEAE